MDQEEHRRWCFHFSRVRTISQHINRPFMLLNHLIWCKQILIAATKYRFCCQLKLWMLWMHWSTWHWVVTFVVLVLLPAPMKYLFLFCLFWFWNVWCITYNHCRVTQRSRNRSDAAPMQMRSWIEMESCVTNYIKIKKGNKLMVFNCWQSPNCSVQRQRSPPKMYLTHVIVLCNRN